MTRFFGILAGMVCHLFGHSWKTVRNDLVRLERCQVCGAQKSRNMPRWTIIKIIR